MYFIIVITKRNSVLQKPNQEIVNRIKWAINKKDPEAEIILFGSQARGTGKKGSDWDVLVLLNIPHVDRKIEKEYREELFDVELDSGVPISTFVFSKQEWETKYAVTPLFQNIKREGVHL